MVPLKLLQYLAGHDRGNGVAVRVEQVDQGLCPQSVMKTGTGPREHVHSY